MTTSLSSDDEVQIGAVFTPLEVGAFAVRTYGLVDRWLRGAMVFDPTMGQGHLLQALVDEAMQLGLTPELLPFDRLFGNERCATHLAAALESFRLKYGVDMSRQFTHGDIFSIAPRPFDIVFGNPPWANYVDLPEHYKRVVKPLFSAYGLVEHTRDLLLGNSRIDVAALVVQRIMADFLRDGGEAVIFLPLSLLLNDGAHKRFRQFRVRDVSFAVTSVYDFASQQVFPGVCTRYGLARLERGRSPSFPVRYIQHNGDAWSERAARPMFATDDPWSIRAVDDGNACFDLPQIVLPKASKPRQGVNTCGANDVFFFDRVEPIDSRLATVTTSDGRVELLPLQYLYPLVTSNVFRGANEHPAKWVLLPYTVDGRVLSPLELCAEVELERYLHRHRERLQQRKGVMLNASISRGLWWSMLGVGPYSFYPYKVIWEAYGRTSFRPMIIPGHWQANQSLQAFIPLQTQAQAEVVCKSLGQRSVEAYLRSLQMEGTMNWAQPGKISKLITTEG